MTPTPEISNVLLTGFCLLCTQSQSQRLQSFSIGNFGFFYLCVFYEEIKNHPVSFYIHSSNALGGTCSNFDKSIRAVNLSGKEIFYECFHHEVMFVLDYILYP